MVLAVVRHAESIENATKYTGFYANPRPYGGTAAHEISKNVVGLTPTGFRQCLWLREALADLTGPELRVYTSTYRRAIDTAEVAFGSQAGGRSKAVRTALLDEQHYGDATYMTKAELLATYPEGADDRRFRKHLWIPPGGGESLAEGVYRRAGQFARLAQADLNAGHHVVAITHHTAILALRALLEQRPVTDLVTEARRAKTPSGAILRYEFTAGRFVRTSMFPPPAM